MARQTSGLSQRFFKPLIISSNLIRATITAGQNSGRIRQDLTLKIVGSNPTPVTKFKINLTLKKMKLIHDLKTIVKGQANLNCVRSGGIAVYHITVEDGTIYSLDIDLSDKQDVGSTATFEAHYDKSVILMRWIRRAYENEELYKVSS